MSVAGKGLQMEGLASTVVSLQRGRYLHHAPILTAHQHTNTSLCVAYLPLPQSTCEAVSHTLPGGTQ